MMNELIEYSILGAKIWGSIALFITITICVIAPLDEDAEWWFITITWPIGFLITGWLCTMWFL